MRAIYSRVSLDDGRHFASVPVRFRGRRLGR